MKRARRFLFAVARGVQRNLSWARVEGFWSHKFLFAGARGVQRNCEATNNAFAVIAEFLFAVARGVQRNSAVYIDTSERARFYSLSRGAYSGTQHALLTGEAAARFYSLSRGAYSGTPALHRALCRLGHVSIRCREGRTAEPGAPRGSRTRVPTCFYSLSRGAYSGTAVGRVHRGGPRVSIRCREGRTAELGDDWIIPVASIKFLFAVARGVQRNKSLSRPIGRKDAFLFAVARGVQRNRTRR